MSRRTSGSRVTPKGTAPQTKGSRQARRSGPAVIHEQNTQLHQGWNQKNQAQRFSPAHGQKKGSRGDR